MGRRGKTAHAEPKSRLSMLKERRGKGGVQWTIRSALRWPKGAGSCSVLDSGEVFEDALDFMLAEIFHDVSFDNVHEDFHDSLDLAADEDTLRSLAASKSEHMPKNIRRPMGMSSRSWSRKLQMLKILFRIEGYEPQGFGDCGGDEGTCQSGDLQTETYERVHLQEDLPASRRCSQLYCGGGQLLTEAVTAPFDGSFDALQPFVSWLSVQPRQEVDCYELFAGKVRISEAFAKGAAVCCSPVT